MTRALRNLATCTAKWPTPAAVLAWLDDQPPFAARAGHLTDMIAGAILV